MASVTLRQLTKMFGDVTAVNALDVAISDGEFLTLLGPSGCGKSTALACIAGLEIPTGGEIVFDDQPVTDLMAHQRNVAMVFQDYALYPHMSVRENMSFGLRQQKVAAADIRQQVDTAAEMLDLTMLLDRRPAELSGGQRQRVAVGRAVVRNPSVFLMDEPLSNLDAGLRIKTRTQIKSLQRTLGVTSVFVTHDQEEAMVLSDRIAVMRLGQLQQIGPPMDVYRDPDNLFVASFIGSPAMNFLEATVQAADGGLACWFADQQVALPASVLRHGQVDGTGRAVVLGIRPTDLQVGGPIEETRGEAMRGEVFLVEPVGPVSYVDVKIGEFVVKAVCEPDDAPQIGETVTLNFLAERARLFDPDSEQRL